MFLSETHQPQILPARCYSDPAFLSEEHTAIFAGSWQFACTTHDVATVGDFQAFDLGEYPLIVWHSPDGYRAFLNVCTHRFSKLTSANCGAMQRLTCQYHGWQYGSDGSTQRIPDAQSFRPLANSQLGLKRLPLIECGKVLMVQLPSSDPDAQSNEKLPSEVRKPLEQYFAAERIQTHKEIWEIAANWKVIIENAIESYHVGCVHADSFSVMPTAESCEHVLQDELTTFRTTFPSQAAAPLRFIERTVHRLLGIAYEELYQQFHVYPNMLLSSSKFVSVLMCVRPASPNSSRFELRIFGDPGNRKNPLAKLAFSLACSWAKKEVRKVLLEDFAILPSIQQGLSSPALPAGGLISTREERIAHFQRYIHRETEQRHQPD
ncbi:MAG: aromatic ring-hydroxylating dioxygenase subunit alpha [Pirellulaceae bacterium]